MIELQNVIKSYELGGEQILALDNFNLSIEKGEFIAITGPSGSGKSTLANIIGGLDMPDKGRVLVDGEDIAKLSDTDLSAYRNKKIGFIFQSFNLQPTYTALENVMIPLIFSRVSNKERIKKSMECLIAVGLEDRINHQPNQLSGGQRQRVCIARALANSPEVIIADEPTGNLDSKRGQEILNLMKDLNRKSGITLIMITHDMNIARQADRILNIIDGKLK